MFVKEKKGGNEIAIVVNVTELWIAAKNVFGIKVYIWIWKG